MFYISFYSRYIKQLLGERSDQSSYIELSKSVKCIKVKHVRADFKNKQIIFGELR